MNRFYVSPCDDENGRTWDVVRRANKENGSVVRSLIRTRAEARKVARDLNEQTEPPRGSSPLPSGGAPGLMEGEDDSTG